MVRDKGEAIVRFKGFTKFKPGLWYVPCKGKALLTHKKRKWRWAKSAGVVLFSCHRS